MQNIIASKLEKQHKFIVWTLIVVLVILRIPFQGFFHVAGKYDWVNMVWEIGTYFIVACLIYIERNQLIQYHIDALALYIIILFKPLETILSALMGFTEDPFSFPNIPAIILWIISISLLLALWRGKYQWEMISIKSIKWFGIGIFSGILVVILLGFPVSFQFTGIKSLSWENVYYLLGQSIPGFFYQMGYAAVSEEPLFRAFLWGALIKAGWKNLWIWILQAGLFMIAHIYYINRAPISFWIYVPFGALFLGALVWKSKTISSSLAAHATTNALGAIIGVIIASLRM